MSGEGGSRGYGCGRTSAARSHGPLDVHGAQPLTEPIKAATLLGCTFVRLGVQAPGCLAVATATGRAGASAAGWRKP